MKTKLSHRAKLTPVQVRAIRRSQRRQMDLAKRYGVSQATISNIKRGVVYKAVSDGRQ